MGVRANKAEVREYLVQRDFGGFAVWADSTRSPQRVLYSLTLDGDEEIAWRAIEFIGRMTGIKDQFNAESTRDSIRRLFWLMNDESGGLGWRSPEIIGEILINVPSLIDEFVGLLPAYFTEEPFERGAYAAAARVSAVRHQAFVENIEDLIESINNPDGAIRYYAAEILWAINPRSHQRIIEKLQNDTAPIAIYDFDTGKLEKTTVEKAVGKVLKQTGSSGQAA